MLGILTVLLGALLLTFHNIIVRVLFSEQTILGVSVLGRYVTPTLQNSFLPMFMRMLLVVPLEAVQIGGILIVTLGIALLSGEQAVTGRSQQ